MLYAARRLRPQDRCSPRGGPGAAAGRWRSSTCSPRPITVALRRADEMGDAITARGGAGQISAAPSRPERADWVALSIVLAVCGAGCRRRCRLTVLANDLALRRGVRRGLGVGQVRRTSRRPRNISSKYGLSASISGGESGAARRGDARAVEHREERADVDAARRPVRRSTPAGPASTAGMAAPLAPRYSLPRVLPIQASTCRTASGCVVAELPAAAMPLVTLTRPVGSGRQHGHAPPERRLVGDRGQVVGAGLEQRHPALQELVAGEVAVVVGVRRGRCDVVVVDQTAPGSRTPAADCGLSNANRSPSENTPPAEPM